MTTTLQKRRYLIESLRRSKEYREGYVDANISNGLATQIKATREAPGRRWTQTELGARAGMAQEVISQLEDPNYGRYTLKTLKRLAAAFDVALIVRFVPFSQLVDWIAELSPEDLAVPSFEDDHQLEELSSPVVVAKHDRAQIAGEIGELMKLLDLDTSAQLASLLRNSGDTYPSSGLIRTYLNMLADPADKFVRLLRARRAEVDGQLREGVQALQIADQLQAIYHVLPKQHIITILTEDQLNQADYQHAQTGGLAVTVLASLAIPGTWLHTCEICNRPFVARSSTSKCCYRRDDAGRLVCRLEARRRSYRERAKQARRAARKAQKGVQVFDMALPPKAF